MVVARTLLWAPPTPGLPGSSSHPSAVCLGSWYVLRCILCAGITHTLPAWHRAGSPVRLGRLCSGTPRALPGFCYIWICIQVHHHELVRVGVKDFVHQREKAILCICWYERRHLPFVWSISGYGSCRWVVPLRDEHLVVAFSEIHLGRVLGLSKSIKLIHDEWDRIFVPNYYLIQHPIVDV